MIASIVFGTIGVLCIAGLILIIRDGIREGEYQPPQWRRHRPYRWQRVRAHRWRLVDAWDRATARAGYWWHRAQVAAGADLTARYRRRYLTPADAHTAALFERMNGRREPDPATWLRWAIAARIAALAVITQAAGDDRWPHLRRQWSDDTGSFEALTGVE